MFNIIRVKNAEEGGKKAFELIKEGVQNGAEVFGLATGSTPETLYQEMVKSDLDFSNCISVNLDEYVGLSGDNDQSYRYFMNEHLFNKKPFKATYVPNGKAEDLEEECRRYEEIISNHPIDIQILGIGENAHIGFNEPGTPFDAPTQVVELTESTINANKRNFEKVEDVPTTAISMGIGSIMKSKKIILMAFGEAKAEAIANTINGGITVDVPASVLQNHADVTIIIDEAAASKL
ncbi:MAG: glucosamine-6-phosphate deaminase [Enterococcus sp.]|nr:glucosamine-6-phosphate deaminase [Enterococcus sp.]MBP8693250.1 glucosamine-6-phosphate deaminase [Enterococcus sp.]MBP9520999.1 glucosamine-6-phosphate deaminase [Enterococcus sp.]MBP9638481.1 glucosamine-6-phosphate deaminase [Enterococcus sp.]HRL51878.1 glucosamine-6-phosphate deaminase [Enterococcus aquimarinus]